MPGAMDAYQRPFVRACKAMTREPFRAPSPFTVIHRPNRVSCPTPATNNVVGAFIDPPFPSPISPLLDDCIQGVMANKLLLGDTKWSELMTPGARMAVRNEKDLSLESSFHSRIEPSQEPVD